MDYENLLPLGSIVLLQGAERKLLIIGRIVSDEKMENIYDYVGVIYPEGLSGDGQQYFFNRDAIELVLFIGFQDDEELSLRSEIFSTLDELEIKDGKIVPKE